LLGTTDGTAFIHPALAIGVTRWYFLKSVDFSGNKSAFTTGVSGTTTGVPTVALVGQVVAAQVADGAINTAKFATGIVPVEILGALPATGNFEGRQVYLTTDNKLYRHTGSPTNASGFTRQTDGADIVANSITAGQIAAGAIGASEIAADAVNADKIAVNAVTAGSIAANAVTAGKIATDAVTSGTIAANAITSGKIAANAITAGKISAGAIDTTELIVDGAVSRRFYAQELVTTTIPTSGTPITVLSKTGMGGKFNAYQGAVGDRSNPIMISLYIRFWLMSAPTSQLDIVVIGERLLSGTWGTVHIYELSALDGQRGPLHWSVTDVEDSINIPGSTGFRIRAFRSTYGGGDIELREASFMLQQISV
jgi:hypothetical protein